MTMTLNSRVEHGRGGFAGEPVAQKETTKICDYAGPLSECEKISDDDVDAMVDFAEKEQIGYGYFDGGGLPPELPSSMNVKYGGY